MIRRPPRSTPKPSSAASDVYKRQHTGFYVRAFAEEFAHSLGDIAYASMIKRLKIGTFDINQAIPYEKILDFSSINDLHTNLITI